MLGTLLEKLEELVLGKENTSIQRRHVERTGNSQQTSKAAENTALLERFAINCHSCNRNSGLPLADSGHRYKCRSCGKPFNGPRHNIVSHNGGYVIDNTNGRWKQYV